LRLIVDTNLLVRVARADDDPVQADAARRLLQSATVIAIPLIVLCEFDWVFRKHYRRPRAEVLASLRALVSLPNVVTDPAPVAAGIAFLAAGGDFADGVIAAEGRRLGGDVFASFDRKARRIAAEAGFAVTDGTAG